MPRTESTLESVASGLYRPRQVEGSIIRRAGFVTSETTQSVQQPEGQVTRSWTLHGSTESTVPDVKLGTPDISGDQTRDGASAGGGSRGGICLISTGIIGDDAALKKRCNPMNMRRCDGRRDHAPRPNQERTDQDAPCGKHYGLSPFIRMF